MNINDALVKEFVDRVSKPGTDEKSADVFKELNDKWLYAVNAAREKDERYVKLFFHTINHVTDNANGVARRKNIDLVIGSVVWVVLFVIGAVVIGKFCQWTLGYFYPTPF